MNFKDFELSLEIVCKNSATYSNYKNSMVIYKYFFNKYDCLKKFRWLYL